MDTVITAEEFIEICIERMERASRNNQAKNAPNKERLSSMDYLSRKAADCVLRSCFFLSPLVQFFFP